MYRRTCLEIRSVEEAESLLRRIDRGEGADDLAPRLFKLFKRFPPNEQDMRHLSLLQQSHQGEGGLAEYCTTFVFVIANEALNDPDMELLDTQKKMTRAHSFG